MCNLDKTYVDVKPRKGYKLAKSQFGKYEEIPKDWEIEKLVDIGKIIGGGTPNSKNEEYWNGDVLWAVPTDITKLQTNYINDTERKITKEGLDSSSAKLLPIGTILLTSRATLGKCTITKKPISTNQGFQNIVCYDKFYNVFVFYQMRFNRNTVIRLSYGTTFLEISKKEIGKILIPVPVSIKEQQKIASILSGVDANIEATQKVIDKTEKLKRGLMQRLLTKGIGHTKFKKINWFFGKEIEIPKEWDIKQVKEVFEFLKTGTNARKDLSKCGNVRYIHYGDIHQKWHLVLDCNSAEIPFIAKKNIKNLSLLQNGDLVIADASEDHEGSGASILIKNVGDKEIVSGLHTFALRDNNDSTDSEFRTYITSIKTVKTQIIAYVTGISVYGLSKTNFKIIKIPIPSFAEQTKIASILSGVDAHIQKNQEYKKKLERLKKGLMQKLLTGQIRVNI